MKMALLESLSTIKMYSLKNMMAMQDVKMRISIIVSFFMGCILIFDKKESEVILGVSATISSFTWIGSFDSVEFAAFVR